MPTTTYDYFVLGGGPAGVAAAYFLSQEGYKVLLVEQRPHLGAKPCGGGVPTQLNMTLTVPADSILNKIRSLTLYFNMKHVGTWDAKETIFYLIDRTKFLEHYSTSFDVALKTSAKVTHLYATINNEKVDISKVIIATGYSWRFRERDMLAQTLQYYVKDIKIDDPSEMKFYFFKDLIGYAWFFPYGEREAKVGIGGLDVTVNQLKVRLDMLLKELNIDTSSITRIDGAPIDMGGIKLEWAKEPTYVVGEALGAVMPLTGEGIRPSILTAKVLAHAIAREKDYREVLGSMKLYKATQLQAKILKKVRKEGKVPTLKELSPKNVEAIYKFGMGEAGIREFLSILPKAFSLSLLKKLI
ncbi:NAD(P)/FAD-dependent oxidoreductase [Ignicoccus hospitalis]|uniref:Dehydrogenase (Flavoprotein)-like protein n=1 Tax=Ignicoccus hospitalis (strain KIN4/I / DSM 18386 / JCM 14125) TaxID=453591 RepID=A8AAD5_IGNH4|nr:NAD(P)/FAD-dependent oxidoreductase [Ignicoccus hospitalis]ABU81887.1 Dehydrogenase (flavoprotein)-like protein [Ignicoccus hospitalis KIN4/I]HIH89955.1 NAD(P)/FAD-dependent oxidoreductase [Desulfurococcaceae archaeon]